MPANSIKVEAIMHQLEPELWTLEITIPYETEVKLKEAPFFLEMEILQGKKQVINEGWAKYIIEIRDKVKAGLMEEFCLKLISRI